MARYIDGPDGGFAKDGGDGWWHLYRRGVLCAAFRAASDAAVIARLSVPASQYEERIVAHDRRRSWLRDLAAVNTTAAGRYAREFGHLGR